MNELVPSIDNNDPFPFSSIEEYPSVALTTSTGLVFVKKADILYCIAENAYTGVYLKGGHKITVAKHLKKVEQALSGDTFVRIHDSNLINLQHLVQYVNEHHSSVLMTNGKELAVSRNKRKGFLQRFVKI
ncbi:MAG: LytTR family DNA-binding domain-containing protein [Bacteroidota bacterium]